MNTQIIQRSTLLTPFKKSITQPTTKSFHSSNTRNSVIKSALLTAKPAHKREEQVKEAAFEKRMVALNMKHGKRALDKLASLTGLSRKDYGLFLKRLQESGAEEGEVLRERLQGMLDSYFQKQELRARLEDLRSTRSHRRNLAPYSVTARMVVLAKDLYRIGEMDFKENYAFIWNQAGGGYDKNSRHSHEWQKMKPEYMASFSNWFLERLMATHPSYSSPEVAEKRIHSLLLKLDHFKPIIP